MAAEGIFLEGKDDVIESRLRHIAPISSWRNVLLFLRLVDVSRLPVVSIFAKKRLRRFVQNLMMT